MTRRYKKRNGPPPIAQRLEQGSMPVTECGCIVWLGYVSKYGYGTLTVDKAPKRVHRLAWEEKNGPIPDGMLVCHICDIRSCINTDHLFLGTAQDNCDDKIAKNRQVISCGEDRAIKLTWELATEIKKATGNQSSIANEFGIDQALVSRIKNGKAWVRKSKIGRAHV